MTKTGNQVEISLRSSSLAYTPAQEIMLFSIQESYLKQKVKFCHLMHLSTLSGLEKMCTFVIPALLIGLLKGYFLKNEWNNKGRLCTSES